MTPSPCAQWTRAAFRRWIQQLRRWLKFLAGADPAGEETGVGQPAQAEGSGVACAAGVILTNAAMDLLTCATGQFVIWGGGNERGASSTSRMGTQTKCSIAPWKLPPRSMELFWIPDLCLVFFLKKRSVCCWWFVHLSCCSGNGLLFLLIFICMRTCCEILLGAQSHWLFD
jgi:hypothetical protein